MDLEVEPRYIRCMRTTADKVSRFEREDGSIVLARRYSDSYAGSGWYGGVSVAMHERNGFSCGARFFFGDDIALLGREITEQETKGMGR